MKETVFNKKFNKHLREKYPILWGEKISGHEMQATSIPDNLYCINSLFIAIEFKIMRDGRISITPRQIKQINKIKDAKGIALIIAYDENNNKILIRERRLDHIEIFLSSSNVKKKTIKIDWDFTYNSYELAIELLSIMIENNRGV